MDDAIDKLDSVKQARMVSAIHKAATLAQGTDANRQQILVNELKKNNVDAKLAKVAARAFNKKCTIQYMNNNADDVRGGDFALVDPDKVAELMSGQIARKTASQSDFIMDFHIGQKKAMQKAASKPANRTAPMVYIADMSIQDGLKRVQTTLDKIANQLDQDRYRTNRHDSALRQAIQDVASEIKRSKHASQVIDAAVSEFGPYVQAVLKDSLPQMSFNSDVQAIPVDRPLHNKIANLIALNRAVQMQLQDKQKFAADAQILVKQAAFMQNQYKQAMLSDESMQKIAAGPLAVGANALGAATILPTAGVIGLGTSYVGDIAQSTADVLEAVKQQSAGGSELPSRFITTKFLTDDRNVDEMLAFSDVLADKSIKDYDVRQIEDAFRGALQTDQSLSRPNKRQLLRTVVRQRLAQNNRVSPADIAAIQQAIKKGDDTKGSAQSIIKQLIAKIPAVESSGDSYGVLSKVLSRFPTDIETPDYGIIDKADAMIQEHRKVRRQQQKQHRKQLDQQLKGEQQVRRKAKESYWKSRNAMITTLMRGGASYRQAVATSGLAMGPQPA